MQRGRVPSYRTQIQTKAQDPVQTIRLAVEKRPRKEEDNDDCLAPWIDQPSSEEPALKKQKTSDTTEEEAEVSDLGELGTQETGTEKAHEDTSLPAANKDSTGSSHVEDKEGDEEKEKEEEEELNTTDKQPIEQDKTGASEEEQTSQEREDKEVPETKTPVTDIEVEGEEPKPKEDEDQRDMEEDEEEKEKEKEKEGESSNEEEEEEEKETGGEKAGEELMEVEFIEDEDAEEEDKRSDIDEDNESEEEEEIPSFFVPDSETEIIDYEYDSGNELVPEKKRDLKELNNDKYLATGVGLTRSGEPNYPSLIDKKGKAREEEEEEEEEGICESDIEEGFSYENYDDKGKPQDFTMSRINKRQREKAENARKEMAQRLFEEMKADPANKDMAERDMKAAITAFLDEVQETLDAAYAGPAIAPKDIQFAIGKSFDDVLRMVPTDYVEKIDIMAVKVLWENVEALFGTIFGNAKKIAESGKAKRIAGDHVVEPTVNERHFQTAVNVMADALPWGRTISDARLGAYRESQQQLFTMAINEEAEGRTGSDADAEEEEQEEEKAKPAETKKSKRKSTPKKNAGGAGSSGRRESSGKDTKKEKKSSKQTSESDAKTTAKNKRGGGGGNKSETKSTEGKKKGGRGKR